MEDEILVESWNDTMLFAEARTSIERKIPYLLISHKNLKVEDMMNYILRGEIPRLQILSFKDEIDTLLKSRDFQTMSSEGKELYLENNYPDFRNWFESVIAGENVWKMAVQREFDNPQYTEPLKGIVDYLDGNRFTESIPEIVREISENFRVRKYRMRASFRGNIDNLFDSLNITDKCLQIVLVKPIEDKVVYKLSNKFGEKITKIHSQRPLVGMPSRRNKLEPYIGMTFTKNKSSNKVVTVLIEEKPAKTSYEQTELEIIFENLEDADGEVVLKYFYQTFSDITSRGKLLKEEIMRLQFNVFDVEIATSVYNKNYLRQAFVNLSSVPALRPFLFTESSNRLDEQRVCLRGITGKVRSRVDFQEKMVVFSSQKDIFEIFDLISLVLAYSYQNPLLSLFEPLEKFLKREQQDESTQNRYEMDIIEIKDGERILKKARFFDSVYSKVCNKPENVPTLGDSIDVTNPDVIFDYFPSEKLIKALTESGQYEFPKYRSQRIPIQLYYGSGVKGKKAETKVRVLGKRPIPRERRDELATSDNLSYIFGYFPCVVTMKRTEYEKNKKAILEQTIGVSDETEEDEEQSTGVEDYIFDETKDEIPSGRLAKTQLNFFNVLKTKPTNDILRTGVEESPASFFQAVLKGSGVSDSFENSVQGLVSKLGSDRKILQAGISQFPDSKPEEIRQKFIKSLTSFLDSKYYVNIVGEHLNVNVVVLQYSTSEGALDYAVFERPNGQLPPNVFEQLNVGRKTVVVIRRIYQTLPDQYDLLVEFDPLQNSLTTQFETERIKRFLRERIALIDISPDIADGGETTRITDLTVQRNFKTPVTFKEQYQVIDSTGSRIGTVFVSNDRIYPVVHAYPTTPAIGLGFTDFINFLDLPRPSVLNIIREMRGSKLVGSGYTTLAKDKYLTSVLIDDMFFLCQPTVVNDDLKTLLRNTAEIETPDPYILRQFSEGSDPQTLLLKRGFADLISFFILQVLFIEVLERYIVKNTFETRTYRDWRKKILSLEINREIPSAENIPETNLLSIVGEIKSLMGEIPNSPISKLSSLTFLSGFFTPEGLIRCYSEQMFDRLDFQLEVFEQVIPSLPIQNNIPRSVYRIRGVYDSMTSLSQSAESITGVGTLTQNAYARWQEECRTSFENTNIYPGITKQFFEISKEEPVLGFHGSRGTGLWVIQSEGDAATESYPILNNSIPNVIYQKETAFNVFNPDVPDNVIRLKKLI